MPDKKLHGSFTAIFIFILTQIIKALTNQIIILKIIYNPFKTVTMKKTGLLFCLISLITLASKAQDYKTAAGIRLGPNSAYITAGLTIKHFLNEKAAIEGIVGLNNGLGICGLYEIHFPIDAVKNLKWFAGAGGYVAFRSSSTYVGGAGIVGLDYKFEDIPLNITLDWKPELNLIGGVRFESSGLGLSARYTF